MKHLKTIHIANDKKEQEGGTKLKIPLNLGPRPAEIANKDNGLYETTPMARIFLSQRNDAESSDHLQSKSFVVVGSRIPSLDEIDGDFAKFLKEKEEEFVVSQTTKANKESNNEISSQKKTAYSGEPDSEPESCNLMSTRRDSARLSVKVFGRFKNKFMEKSM